MSTIDNLKGSHGEMQEMINDLRAMMTKDQLKIRPNAMTTHKLLCELAGKMKSHMSSQDQEIYPGLLIHQDPKLKSMAWGFLNGQKPGKPPAGHGSPINSVNGFNAAKAVVYAGAPVDLENR